MYVVRYWHTFFNNKVFMILDDKIMKDRCKVIFYVDNLLTFLVISPYKVRNATVIPYRAFSIFATFVREVALSA